MKLTDGTGDVEDIDLQVADYSDDDVEIYFNEKTLIEYLFKLEDENLFNVNLCQNEEEHLEEELRNSKAKFDQMQVKLEVTTSNLQKKKMHLEILQQKNDFYKNNSSGQVESKKNVKVKSDPIDSALDKYLINNGASKTDIQEINEGIAGLLECAGIPINKDRQNMIQSMKALEIKLKTLQQDRIECLEFSAAASKEYLEAQFEA